MKPKRAWMLQVRYVEYVAGKRVYAAQWRNYIDYRKVPEGCLLVGGLTRKEASRVKKTFARTDMRRLCSNFEYRAI